MMHEMQKTIIMLNILDKIKKNADFKNKYISKKYYKKKVLHAGKKVKRKHKKPGRDLTFSCFSTVQKQTAFLKK